MAFDNNPNATATVTLPEPVIVEPETQVYAEGFELNTGGWAATNGTVYRFSEGSAGFPAYAGTGMLAMAASTPTPYTSKATRVFTGLTAGRAYKLTVRGRLTSTGGTGLRIGATGIGATAWQNTAASWLPFQYVFTATSTSHELFLEGSSSSNYTYWDAVALTAQAVTAVGTAVLQLSDGDLTLDSSRYPYAEASVEVPFTSEDLLEQIKPGQRVTLAATSEGEHVKTYTPWVEQRRNLIANPAFRTNTTTWTAAAGGGAAATITRPATLPAGAIPDFDAVAPGYARITYTTTGTWYRAAATSGTVTPGQAYTLSGWLRGAPAGVAFRLFIQWRTSGGSLIYEAASPNITLTSAFERMSFTDVAPANAAYATIQYGRASAQVGDFFDLTGAMFEAADSARDYFDGATANDEFTQTRWLGTADASTSVLETRSLERVDWVPAPGITADLALRSRKVSHDSKKITLSLASDEWMLERWAPIADDSTPRTHEENLRNLINYVLNKAIPGAALQAGTTNAAIPASWSATNLMTNPTAGLDLSGWSNTQGTISRLTTGTFPANTSLASAVRATMNAGADRGPYFNGGDDGTVLGGTLNVAIREKQLYRVSMYVRTNTARTMRLIVTQRNSANATAGRNLHGPNFNTTANTWTRVSYVFQAYPGAVRMGVFPYLPSSTYAAGNTVDVTGVMVTEGTLDHSYFDGGTIVRPDLYTYEWNDQAHVSTSERKAIQERRPELFTWKAGQNAWDFLKPLVASAGYRLFADEQRRWWLINPVDWSVPGRFSARPDNTVQGTDTMDADDEDNGYTGVVARYRWTDADGISREKVDAAGVSGHIKPLEFDREYTGPGVAASHLKKVQGLGRVQDVTVETDYAVRPGQEVQIDLPGTSPQLGSITRVQWELTNGLMSIGSAGLRETPVGAIDLLNTTIDGLPGTIDSL